MRRKRPRRGRNGLAGGGAWLRLAATAAAVAAIAAAGCRPGPPRPDVVIVTIDTLRSDHCSAYGYPVATTPNLEKLASEGVLYRRAYSETSTTAPSHAVLMSGRHFRTFGLRKNGGSMPSDVVTLAEAMKEAGYETAAFVSSLPLMSRFGFAQGFDTFDDSFQVEDASIGRRHAGRMPHDRIAAATLAHAEAFLDRRSTSRPLFLWVHFVDPHQPYRPPEPFDGGWPVGVKPNIRNYDGEVHYADAQLGRLVDALAKKDTSRGQLIVVTSDHGEGLGDHGWKTHGINLYEEAVHVPLVARYTGVLPAKRMVEEPVGVIDIAPGILGLLGIESKAFDHGEKLFEPADPSRAIHLQRRDYKSRKERGRAVGGEMDGIVTGTSKLITAPEEQRRELYDLAADPHELANLLQPDPASPAAAASGTAADATARMLEDNVARWKESYPAAEKSEEPLDKETLRALRALGYVD